jgi:hypothetical protein
MSFDTSRFTFDPWKSYSGVVMEQGRVQTDADWNEWLSEQSRRTRAGTLDILGHAVCPVTTPNAFKIDATSSGDLRIGLGRFYIDGILVENHGDESKAVWDPALAELSNVPQPQPSTPQPLDASNSILFENQPYNDGATVPSGPGQYVAYLDVWQRPITYIEDSNLIDPAIGIDTTGRIQTAWRVNLLPMPAVVVQGSITSSSGTFSPGDLVTQANTGATAIVIGTVPAAGPMILSLVSGAPDGTSIWNDPSGAQFTPTSEPEDVGAFIAGSVTSSAAFVSGETVVQASTGASATLSDTVPTGGPMIVGPISGIPAPFANWVGQTSGAVFAPVSLPSGSVSSIQGAVSAGTFIANEQVIQNSTGALANLIGPVPTSGPMLVGAITGSPDDVNDWVGQTSDATFTPSAFPVASGWSCSTSDYSIPWPGSSGILTTQPATSPKTGPCCLTTGSGYTGPENQFYRIEIHTPGGAGGAGATFKWSRENASVQTAVTAISAATNTLGNPTNALTVQSLGRDQVLGFSAGDWIEITDESHDNVCLPGEIYKIDSISVPDSSIVLTTPLSTNFSSTTLGNNAYTRIIRWDQSGQVYNIEGGKQVAYYNLDASSSPSAPPNGCTGIPIPSDGSAVVLEDGVAVSFGLSIANGSFQAMDYWNFTARTADGSIEQLKNAPPSGIAHHYTKLSIVSLGISPTPSATDCRTLWPPSCSCGGGDCGCCCSVTVGTAPGTHAKFSSIQKAIDSLAHGGEVCLEPGNYYENINIEGRRNITITGCGESTRVHSLSLQPGGSSLTAATPISLSGFEGVFNIVASQNITIESMLISAAEDELGILMDQGATTLTSATNSIFQLPDTDILLTELEISASKMPAIGARYVTNLTICDNQIQKKDVASLYPAVYLEGDSIRFERNLVEIESAASILHEIDPIVAFSASDKKTLKSLSKAAADAAARDLSSSSSASGGVIGRVTAKAPQLDAVGGVQVGGPSNDIWIVENEIEGGARNGITLGNIIYLDKGGNRDGSLPGEILDPDSPCSSGGSSTIPGTHNIGTTPTPVASGGRIRNLHILRNRIRDVGMCGIGPVGFFDFTNTREIVSLINVLIAENILINTLRRNVLTDTIKESPYGYGVISLPDVTNLLIRSNIIMNYGITPGAEVCGIYVYHGEGIEIDSNEIRESRDLSGFGDQKYTNYGGKRAGIYIDRVTPPTLDTSAGSVWTEAAGSIVEGGSSDTYLYQPPDYAPGYSALRIENNDVRAAFGLALYAFGTGPFSILGNHFATGGTVSSDSIQMRDLQFATPDLAAVGTVTGALTVEVLNMGLALEATEFIDAFLKLIAAETSVPAAITNTLSVTNGTVLFSNNICQLMTKLNSVRGISSVFITTLDHLMFTNNQLWINGKRKTALVDAFLFGFSAQAISNRLQESAGSVRDSGASYGFMNVTSQNICTYCLRSKAFKPEWRVHEPNVIFDDARCQARPPLTH